MINRAAVRGVRRLRAMGSRAHSMKRFDAVASGLFALGLLLAGCENVQVAVSPLQLNPLDINGRDGGGKPLDYQALMRIGAAAHAGGDLATAVGDLSPRRLRWICGNVRAIDCAWQHACRDGPNQRGDRRLQFGAGAQSSRSRSVARRGSRLSAYRQAATGRPAAVGRLQGDAGRSEAPAADRRGGRFHRSARRGTGALSPRPRIAAAATRGCR